MKGVINRDPLDSGLRDATPLGAQAVPELAEPVRALTAPQSNVIELKPAMSRTEALKAISNGMTAQQAIDQSTQLAMTGLPYSMALQAPEVLAQAAEAEKQERIAEMARNTPALAKWREQNPHHAAIAEEKFREMGRLEWALKAIPEAARRGGWQNELTNINRADLDGQLTPELEARRDVLEQALAKGGEGLGSSTWAGGLVTGMPEQLATLIRTTEAGAKLGVRTAALAGVVSAVVPELRPLTGPIIGSVFKTSMVVGSGVEEGRIEEANAFGEYTRIVGPDGQRIDRDTAKLAAHVVGVINGAFGMAGAKLLYDTIPGVAGMSREAIKDAIGTALANPTVRQKLVALAAEIGGTYAKEITIETGQRAATIIAEHWARDQSGIPLRPAGDVAGDLVGEAKGAALMFPAMLAPGAGIQTYRIVRETKFNETRPDKTLKDINAAAKNIPADEAPQVFQPFVKDAAAGTGKEAAYIDVDAFDTLYQSEDTDPREAAIEMFGSAEAYDDAIVTGRIVVPMEVWVTNVAKSKHADTLAENAAFTPDGATAAEMAIEFGEKPIPGADATPESVGATDGNVSDLKKLEDDIRGQLVGSGYTPEAADIFAKFFASGYGASGRGVWDLQQVLSKYAPIINRSMPGLEKLTRDPLFENKVFRAMSGQIPTDKDVYGDDLIAFIKSRGGMRYDRGGEMKAVDSRLNPGIVNKNSKYGISRMTEMAWGEGYISENSEQEFLDTFADAMRGEAVYARHSQTGDVGLAPTGTVAFDTEAANLRAELDSINEALDQYEIDTKGKTPKQIADELTAAFQKDYEGVQRGNTLFQSEPTGDKQTGKGKGKRTPKDAQAKNRGSVTFTGTQAIIELMKTADRSTLIHEGAHIWLRILMEIAQLKEAPQQAKDDLATLMKWWGITSPDQITTEHEEQFARGFEKWVAKGESPSIALRDVFSAFSAWLMRIYKGVVQRGIKVSPDVEAVMGRMMATEAEIQAAKEQKGVLDLLAEIDKQGILKPDEAMAYSHEIRRIHDDAVEMQLKRSMATKARAAEEMTAAHKAAIKEEVTAEVHDMRVYKAISAMARGTKPDGTPLEGVENLKIQAADLAAQFGTDSRSTVEKDGKEQKKTERNPITSRLRELGLVASGRKQYTANANGKKVRAPDLGMTLEDIRRITGYGSVIEMVNDIVAAPDMKDAIQQETDRRVRVEVADEMHDTTAAIEAVDDLRDGDGAMKVALADQRILKQIAARLAKARRIAKNEQEQANKAEKAADKEATKQAAAAAGPIVTKAIARSYARNRLRNMMVGAIKPETYRLSARRASLMAIEATRKKDYAAAIKYKQQEILNIAMYLESRKIEADISKKRNQMLALSSPTMRKAIGRAGQGYLEQIEGILATVEMKKISAKRREQIPSLQEFVQALQTEIKDGTINVESVWHIQPALTDIVMRGAKPYQNMTVAEFDALHDDIIQMATLARNATKMMDAADAKTLDENQATLASAVIDNAREGRTALTTPEMRGPHVSSKRWIKGFRLDHRNFASKVREVVDGLNDNGAGFKLLLKGMQKASDTQAKMHGEATAALAKMIGKYTLKERTNMRKPMLVPGTTLELSREARIVFALNMGNQDGAQKTMAAGFAHRVKMNADGSTSPIPVTEKEAIAILNSLDKKDVGFANAVWALIDSYYDDVAANEKRVRGVAAPRVKAVPFTVKGGELTGGYIPISPEGRSSVTYFDTLKDQAMRLMDGGGTTVLPSRDFTHERKANAKHAPMRLDFGVITNHIAEVTHYLAYYNYIVDATRLLGDARVKGAIKSIYGDQWYTALREDLIRVAAGHTQSEGNTAAFAQRLRVGATAGAMGFKLLTGMVQLLGVIPAFVRVGPSWILKGAASGAMMEHGGLIRTRKWTRQQSEFMARRGQTQNREMVELHSKWLATSVANAAYQNVASSMFWLILQGQSMVDTIVWMGAYEKALAPREQGGLGAESHEDAVLLADRTVRDTQGSGQIADLSKVMAGGEWSRLFTTFFSYMNQMGMLSEEAIAKARLIGGPGGAAFAFASLAAILILPAVMQDAMYAALRGDWDDDEPEDIAKKLARTAIAAPFGMFAWARESQGAIEGFDNYRGPGGIRPIGGLIDLSVQAQQGELDRAFWNAAMTGGSAAVPIPSGALMNLYDAVESDGEPRPAWMVAMFGRAQQGK